MTYFRWHDESRRRRANVRVLERAKRGVLRGNRSGGGRGGAGVAITKMSTSS